MAGKAAGATYWRSLTYPPGAQMSQRLTRAYAEGRGVIPSSTNPHASGTPEYDAWQDGYDNRADAAGSLETAIA